MTQKTRLYLLGGSPAYAVYADDFVAASGGNSARIAALAQTRTGWEKHKSEIIAPWKQRGVTHYELIAPNEEGMFDTEKAIGLLKNSTGIFISGGHTPTYHKLFAAEPIRSTIQARYQQGIPVAGVSAGALISMEKCQLTTNETGKDCIEIVEGLSLAKGFVIGVHFAETEGEALSKMLDTMKTTRIEVGIGIDEPACVVCENGEILKVLGKSVHRIEMTDFENTIYEELVS
jgi:cyanophycinase